MCTDLYLYYACGCQHSVKKQHSICEHAKFLHSLREFLPGTASSQFYKNLCAENHKVFSSRFKIYCSICAAEEAEVTRKVEKSGLVLSILGTPLPEQLKEWES
jgi:hypothetical protein